MAHGHNKAVTLGVTLITVGALGSLAAITGSSKIDASRLQGSRVVKIRAHMEFLAKTSGEGPWVVGYNIDTTTQETADALNADPQHRSDPSGLAQQNKVVPIWVIPFSATASLTTLESHEMEMHDIYLPYKDVIEGSQLNWFVFNLEAATQTSGAAVRITHVIVEEWRAD